MDLFKSITDKVTDTSQPTLAQMWFSKKSSKDKVEKGEPSSDDKNLFKSPNKFASKVKTKRTGRCTDQESDSGDDDFIKSSQETNESWLRKKIRTYSIKSNTPTKSQKTNNTEPPGSVEKQPSIGDICEVSSTIIKEELNEMYENIDVNSSIEMTHDLSGLIVDDRPPPSVALGSSPAMISEEDIKVETMSVDMNEEGEEDDMSRNNETTHVTKRKRRASASKLSSPKATPKKISKTKPDQKNQVSSAKREKKRKSSENNQCPFNLSVKELQFLKDLEVKLEHEVPPQHKVERLGGSRALSEDEVSEFESYGPIKKGTYTESEDQIIRNNWERFCEIHNWDQDNVDPFLYFRHNNQYYISEKQERANFVRFLANDLPWRTLFSVHTRFRNLYSNSINGPYSEKEDQIIMNFLLQFSNDTVMKNEISTVAKLLKRKRLSVWQRFQKLKKTIKEESFIDDEISNEQDEDEHDKTKATKRKRSSSGKTDSENNKSKKILGTKKKSVGNAKIVSDKENRSDDNRKEEKKKRSISVQKKAIQPEKVTVYSQVKWTHLLVNKLVSTLMDITATKNIMDLKDVEIDQSVWKAIENQMSIDMKCLQSFWYSQLHMQIFCPGPLYLNDLKIDLIETMHNNKFTSLEDIESGITFSKFKGVTTEFLLSLVEHLLYFASSKTDSSDFRTNVKYLYENHLSELEDKRMDKVLPKLYFKNGKIVHVDRGLEKRIPNRTTTDPLSDDE